ADRVDRTEHLADPVVDLVEDGADLILAPVRVRRLTKQLLQLELLEEEELEVAEIGLVVVERLGHGRHLLNESSFIFDQGRAVRQSPSVITSRPMSATSRISLENKVVIVTGASRGIGESIARAAVEAGAAVVLASRKQADLDRVAAELGAHGGKVLAVACHTGKEADVAALFAKAIETYGRVDGLVNNAATNPYFGPMVDIPEAAIDKTIEVNVKGYLYCARALAKHAQARGGGASIVSVASVGGMRAAPMQGVYAMTKAAVISMTQTLAFELGGSGIRVNAIAPGLVETKFA